ncbi:unnamed protein product [Symbiodinium sp. CCMP2592]|nr:unnamed protein product [Symbiodinium sp. CCMP2592]
MLGLMRHFLTLGSRRWEEAQLLQVARNEDRDYIMLSAARGAEVQAAMRALKDLLHKPMRAIPTGEVTAALASLRFRLGSAAVSAMHVLIRTPRQNLPYCMFGVLQKDAAGRQEALRKLTSFPPCMHDSLFSLLRQHFPSDADLESSDFEAVLTALAAAYCVDISTIESRHASSREFTLLRSRGWVPNLEAVGSKFATQRYANAPPASAPPEKTAEKPKQPRGGGGPWRAFVSDQSAGRQFSSTTALSEQYHALADHEKQRYKDAGAAGTAAHQAGFPSFGDSRRRQQRQRLRSLPPPARAGEILPGGAIVLPDVERPNQVVPYSGPSFEEELEQHIAQITAPGILGNDGLNEAEVLEIESFQQDLPAGAPLLAVFEGQNALQQSFSRDTFSRTQSRGLSERGVSITGLTWTPPIARLVEASLGKGNLSTRRKLGTNQQLAEQWKKRCSIYLHDMQPPIDPRVVRMHRKSVCLQAGICVCQSGNPEKGPQSWQLCTRLRKKLKQLCPKGSHRRGLVDQRRLVLAWSSAEKEEVLFFHIAYINLTTLHFAGQQLHEASELADAQPFQRQGVLQLASQTARQCGSAMDVFSDVQFIQAKLDFDEAWRVQLHEISELDQDWLSHDLFPYAVPVRLLRDVPLFGVWSGGDDPARRQAPAEKPRAHHRAAASAPAPDSSEVAADVEEQPQEPLYEEEADESSSSQGSDVLNELEEVEEGDEWQDVEEALNPEAAQPADRLPAEEAEPAEPPEAAAPRSRAPPASDPIAGEQFDVPGLGSVRYFPHANRLTAVCRRHPDCRITRSTLSSDFQTRNFRGQGRPIGRLVSWLQKQNEAEFSDARKHIHDCVPSLEERQAAREYFLGLPNGGAFAMRAERRPRDNEPDEPECIR